MSGTVRNLTTLVSQVLACSLSALEHMLSRGLRVRHLQRSLSRCLGRCSLNHLVLFSCEDRCQFLLCILLLWWLLLLREHHRSVQSAMLHAFIGVLLLLSLF
jgi:hypothetical protein